MGAAVSGGTSGESSDSKGFSGPGERAAFSVCMVVLVAIIFGTFACLCICTKKQTQRINKVKQSEKQELAEWKRSRTGNRVWKIATDIIADVDKEFAEQTSARAKLQGTGASADWVSLPVCDTKESRIAMDCDTKESRIAIDCNTKESKIEMERRGPTPASETSTPIDVSRSQVDKAETRTVRAAQIVLEVMEQELAASNSVGAIMGVRRISDPSSETPEYSRFCVPLKDSHMLHYDFLAGHSDFLIGPFGLKRCEDQLKLTQI